MSNKLSLFNYTQPELMSGLVQNTRRNEAGEPIGISLTLAKRRDVAKAFGLQTKGQGTTDKLIELSDAMKQATAAEFMKMAASNDWTGAGFSVRTGKNGVMRATARLVSIKRENKSITEDQLAKALAAMTEEQQIALMERAEALARAAKAPVVDVAAAAAPAVA